MLRLLSYSAKLAPRSPKSFVLGLMLVMWPVICGSNSSGPAGPSAALAQAQLSCHPRVDHIEFTQSVQRGIGVDVVSEPSFWPGPLHRRPPGAPMPTPAVPLVQHRVTTMRAYVYSEGPCAPGEVWAAFKYMRADGSCLIAPSCWDLPASGGAVKSGQDPVWLRTDESETFNATLYPDSDALYIRACVGRWQCFGDFCRAQLPGDDCIDQEIRFVPKEKIRILGVPIDNQSRNASNECKGLPEVEYIREGFAEQMHNAIWPIPDYDDSGYRLLSSRPIQTFDGVDSANGRALIFERLERQARKEKTDYAAGFVRCYPGGHADKKSFIAGATYLTPLYFAHEMGHIYGLEDHQDYRVTGQVGWDVLARTSELKGFRFLRPHVRLPDLLDLMITQQANPERWCSESDYQHVLGSLRPPEHSRQPNEHYLIQGFFSPDMSTSGKVNRVLETTDAIPVDESEVGNCEVRLVDRQGGVLWSSRFQVSGSGMSTFSLRAPIVPQAAGAELYRDGSLQHRLQRTAAAPLITVTNPIAGQQLTHTLTVVWEMTDPDSDSLEADILYSADHGSTWTVIAAGAQSPWHMPTADLPSSSHARLRLRVNDSFNTALAEVAGLHMEGNREPRALIVSPREGFRINTGRSLVFIGKGYDPEDGYLRTHQLAWYSDRDGFIGYGSGLNLRGPMTSTRPFSVGTHRIELRVTDSEGRCASDHATIEIY